MQYLPSQLNPPPPPQIEGKERNESKPSPPPQLPSHTLKKIMPVFSILGAFLGYKLRVYKKKRGATSSPRPPPALLPCPNICLWFFGFGLRAVFSVESNYQIALVLHYFTQVLAPLFQPIRIKTKTNRSSLLSATCNYFEF